MRRRGLSLLIAIVTLLVAFPLSATAAAPDIARISTTSYFDTAGNENVGICDADMAVSARVSYSGVGKVLGGKGTGELSVTTYYDSIAFWGPITINGKAYYVEGGGQLYCVGGSSAIIVGTYALYSGVLVLNGVQAEVDLEDGTCGSLAGSIIDGVHRNQGSLSLTLSGVGNFCSK